MDDLHGLLSEAARLEREGIPATLCTIVGANGSTPRGVGARMIVYADGSIAGTIGGGALERCVADRCRLAPPDGPTVLGLDLGRDLAMPCGGRLDVLLEPLGLAPRLLLFGAGHIARALAPIASDMGFRIVVIDDRPDCACRERFPRATAFRHGFEPSAWLDVPLDERTYAVIVTAGHAHDLAVLRSLVGRDLAYIGMIGSRAKVAAAFEALLSEGVAEDLASRVHAPIGLDIGAETPVEIAVSIAAELVKVRRRDGP